MGMNDQAQVSIPPRVRVVMGASWVFQHWLVIWLGAFTLFNVLPYLAPVLMWLGWEPLARVIYTLYGTISHQLAHRSFFFFGQQVTYPLEAFPLELVGEFLPDSTALRQFIGNAEMGWKVAWSDRLVSMFGAALVTSYMYAQLRRNTNFRPLGRVGMLILVTPLLLDGITHYISDFGSLSAGFRWDNGWLATLTVNSLPPSFYVGDDWGSFNSIMRLISGILFGIGLMGWGLPISESYFARNASILEARLANWWQRQQAEQAE
ncbi:MAG: hypothetical protein ACFE0Q_11620 [Anaerolineae bacterium]